MNRNPNMLSAQKVKIHGMVSSRWTTKDKITQYKGSIKLYTRDKRIMDLDKVVNEKKQQKELKRIQEEIFENRKTLNTAVHGDRQKLRNTLQDHRELQLALDKSQPQKVIEIINQVEFAKRKELDRMTYKMKKKSEELIKLKLKHEEIVDRIQMENETGYMIKEEREAHLITGYVQNAILKKEAARAIQRTYCQMIDIMKKDALYYDAVLITIRNDGVNQGKCLINATKLGQFATEYLDDRKKEFGRLEKVVLKDMMQRKNDLEKAYSKIEWLLQTTRSMMRTDNDINLGKIQIEPSESMLNLTDEIDGIENTLSYMKHAIFVSTFDEIYPCLQEQLKQKERLQEFVEKCRKNRDILLNKKNRAEIMKLLLETSMTDSTLAYKSEKNSFLNDIEMQKRRKDDTIKLIKVRLLLLAKMNCCVKHLQSIANLFSTTKRQKVDKIALMKRMIKVHSINNLPEVPDREEVDGTKIVKDLYTKYTKLSSICKESSGVSTYLQYFYFEEMIHKRTHTVQLDKPVVEESLVEGIFLDPTILSREDIKKESADIVAINLKNEELLPTK